MKYSTAILGLCQARSLALTCVQASVSLLQQYKFYYGEHYFFCFFVPLNLSNDPGVAPSSVLDANKLAVHVGKSARLRARPGL